MGVSGSGKSTIAKTLSKKLGVNYYDADNYHSRSNISKMSKGIPLDDKDRYPWLNTLSHKIKEWEASNSQLSILACSSLKQEYRKILTEKTENLRFIYLKVNSQTAYSRLVQRKNHFMPESLLQTQFDALEEPEDAFIIDNNKSVDETITSIIKYIETEFGF